MSAPSADTGPASAPERLFTLLCTALSLFQLGVTYGFTVNPILHVAVFVSFTCALVFLQSAIARSATAHPAWRALSWMLAGASAAAGAVYVWRFPWIATRWPLVDALSPLDLVCGLVLLLAVVDVTRRAVGMTLVCVITVFLGYVLFGHRLPGLFYHRPLSIPDVIDHLVFTGNGLFGAPVAVAATYVYTFVIFGTALERSGGGDFLFRAASTLTGKTAGGPAKVAVVSSALYGSISGSPTSNVMTTGLFTIPMMIRSGLRPEVAGGIEAVAATGGALLPPVMGSAAFLMAELTGLSYFSICVAATTPALLFYFCLFMQVHFDASRRALPAGESIAPPSRVVLAEGVHHLVPLVALVLSLALGRSAITAAGIAILLTVLVSWRDRATRIGWREALHILDLSARRSLVVTAACAAAGIVVGAIVTTGLSGKITTLIFAAAGGSIFMALLATMVVCTILGMGIPVPSAYVVTAVLAGPPLAALGLTPMAANLFILYYASLSAITPPVAVAAFAAASIAGVNPNRVGLQACRLGIIAFIMPFFFVYRPALLLVGSPLGVAHAVAAAAVGALLIAGALAGFMRKPMPMGERMLAFGTGLALVIPGLATDIIGAVVAGAILVRQYGRPRETTATRGTPRDGVGAA